MISTRPSRRAAVHLASTTRTTAAEHVTPSLHRKLFRDVLAMGLPSMASFLMLTIYDLIDIFWLARLGEAPVAAVTAFMAYLWVLSFANMIVGAGSVAFISRRFGEGDARRTAQSIKNTFLLKTIVGVSAGALGFFTTRAALTLMGAAPDVVELGVQYGQIQCAALGAALVSFSVYTAFRGIGRPTLGMWISVAGMIVNLVLDPLLIFGIGPFPELGIRGASIASACGFLTVTLGGMAGLASPLSSVRVRWWSSPGVDVGEMKAMLRIGAPGGITSLSLALFGSVIVKLVAVYGTSAVALFGMAGKILGFGRMLIGGLGLGTGALIGQHLGAGRLERAWVTSIVSMRLGVATMLLFSAGVAAFAPQIVRFFFSDPELVAQGARFLRLMAIGLPFSAISGVAENSFSGAGLNAPPMRVRVASSWAITVPLVLVMGHVAGWGAPGAMAGMSLGEILGSVLFLILLRRGSWLAHKI